MKYAFHRLSAGLLYLFLTMIFALLLYIIYSVRTAPVGEYCAAVRSGMAMLRQAVVSLTLAAAGTFSLELVIRSREDS